MAGKTLLRHVLTLLLTVWVAATINFFVPRLAPGDPIESKLIRLQEAGGGYDRGMEEFLEIYNERFGLDQPLWQQYFRYMGDIAQFDLGYSIDQFPTPVIELIARALPWTIGLLGSATLIAFTLGTLIGALTVWPRTARVASKFVPPLMVLTALPFYLLGLVFIYLFAIVWPIFPTGGGHSIFSFPNLSWSFAREVLYHSFLPAMSIIAASLGVWALGMRGMMVTVQGEDYVLFAKAKGLTQRRSFFRYGVRNALLPQITMLALTFGHIVTGAALVEVVFSYPGIGLLLYSAIFNLDYFVIYGVVFILILSIALSMLFVDLINPLLDPRIRRAST